MGGAMAEVKKTSRRGKKIEGRLGIAARTLENSAALPRPFLRVLQVKQQREPDREMVIAQPAGAVLEIRFQMIDGIAVFGMAGTRDIAPRLCQPATLHLQHTGEDRPILPLV